MGRTCGEPDEIKKNTHPKYFTALFREQVNHAVAFNNTMAFHVTKHGNRFNGCYIDGGKWIVHTRPRASDV